MLVSLTENKAKFCELVEHPGGSDGGDFPQFTTFGVTDDGSAYYATEFPQSPTDTFCDEEPEEYVAAEDHASAACVLLAALEQFFGSDAQELPVYKAFCAASGFTRYFEDEVYTG